MSSKLTDELQSFQGIWKNGYYEGDPLHPLAKTSYGQLGYISSLHATYLRCIRPYVNEQTVSLEIGPGRGAWTKTLLPSREVYALDALPEKHNGFFDYLGHPKHVKYFQVSDFACAMLPEDHFNFMFSFGCLCHVSFSGIQAYATNIFPKLKKGSNCFWMVADYDKFNAAVAHLDEVSILSHLMPKSRKHIPLKWFFRSLMKREKLKPLKPDDNDDPRPGRWYHAGVKRTCAMLESVGYQIVDPDVGTCIRDPIIHFVKP